MDHRKKAALILGMLFLFSTVVTGCAGVIPDKEGSGSSSVQEGGEINDGEQGEEKRQSDSGEMETQMTAPEGEGSQEDEAKFSNLNEFQALALDGSTVTQDIFADRDITVINLWALSCGPCLAEMPDLAEIGKALPDNVQLMTVCLDGSGNEEYVEYVLEQTGYEGVTILAGDGDLLTFCQELQYTPTTVFVDHEGNMVGEAIIGGRENLAEVYLAYINSALTELGKDEISIDTEAGTE